MRKGFNLPNFLVLLFLILISLFLFIWFLDQATGTFMIRRMVCSAFFWLPFANVFTMLTGGCEAIPV